MKSTKRNLLAKDPSTTSSTTSWSSGMVWQGRKEILILWHQMVNVQIVWCGKCESWMPQFHVFFKYLMLKVMHRTVWSYVLSDLVFWPHSLALATSYFQLLLGCLQKLSSETVLWKILVHQISCLTREMNSAKTFPDPRWPPLYNVTTPCARHVHEKKVCRLQRATQTMHWPSKTAKTLAFATHNADTARGRNK